MTLAHGISQAELAEYHALMTQKKQVERALEVRRAALIERINDGASIEPGQFRAEVRSYTQQRLTAEALEEILGPAEVEALKSQVTPTFRTELRVSPNPSR
jgi:hypothetical protein